MQMESGDMYNGLARKNLEKLREDVDREEVEKSSVEVSTNNV